MPRILLIEDDDSLRNGLRLGLAAQGHEVLPAATGQAGLDLLWDRSTDAVILDLMLPDLDGLEVCRRIRNGCPVPVIMLTACGADDDIVRGLAMGADDYVVKPVRARVLDARIRAVLRGVRATPRTERLAETHAGLTLDRSALTVVKHGQALTLTPLELRLLLQLSAAPGHVHSRADLLQQVWGHAATADPRLVDYCVTRLRTKIEDDPTRPLYIQTVRGFGYRFGPL
ncbi:response regulator transcription factor [Streptomyces noursei]|uniref:response regulator transcription factor n=1 Tax=Streptomyces TaxID=1883 RepID=UPI0035D8D223